MKTYTGPNTVKAGVIQGIGGYIELESQPRANINFLMLSTGERVQVSDEFMAHFKPQVGGYFLISDRDGATYMDGEEFREKYVEVEGQL